MREYLLSLLVVSLILAVIGILAPDGEKGGLSKHVRLVAALVWICVLISPLSHIISDVRDWWNGELLSIEEEPARDYQEQALQALDQASKDYFCDMLTQVLEENFSLSPGTVRVQVFWSQGESEIKPEKITLLLSGSAVWQSPKEMEQFVKELIGCECISAIE